MNLPDTHPYSVGINSAITLLCSDSYTALAVKLAGRKKHFKRDLHLVRSYRTLIIRELLELKTSNSVGFEEAKKFVLKNAIP